MRRRKKKKVMDHELNQEKPSPPTIIQQLNDPPTAPVLFSPSGQLSPYPSVPSGPTPGGQSEYIHQCPSQSTVPTGPTMSHSLVYLYNQTSGSVANQTSTPVNSVSQLFGSSKAREAGELWKLPSTTQSGIPMGFTSHSLSNTTSKGAMRHEDSSIRLSPREAVKSPLCILRDECLSRLRTIGHSCYLSTRFRDFYPRFIPNCS